MGQQMKLSLSELQAHSNKHHIHMSKISSISLFYIYRSIFSSPLPHTPTLPILRKLSAILHKSDAVVVHIALANLRTTVIFFKFTRRLGFRFLVRHVKATADFTRVSDWYSLLSINKKGNDAGKGAATRSTGSKGRIAKQG